MKRMLTILMGAAWVVMAGASAATAAESTPAMTELRELVRDAEMRLPGSPGNLLLQDKIGRLFESSGLPSGSMTFTTPVFVPGSASLELAGEEPIRLSTFGPTVGRPGNFAERDFEANLVYLGRGETADWEKLEGRSLQGAIAVMDYGCGDLWLRFLRLGVKGFIFIGPDRYLHADSVAKLYTSEVAVPRYFIPAAEGARLRERLQSPESVKVRIRNEPSVWREATLQNHWVLIPGQDPALSNEVAAVVAPMDSQAAVPELSYGAQSAANVLLLTRVLESMRKTPPARSILLVAVNGHTLNFLGERLLAWNLLSPQLEVEKVRNTLAQELRSQAVLLEKYQPLVLDGTKDAADQEYLIKLRKMSDDTSGKILSIKEPAVAMAKRDLNQVKSRMAELVRDGLEAGDNRARFEALQTERDRFTHVLTLFNKVGIVSTWGELTPDERGVLKGYINEIRQMLVRGIELNRQDLEVSEANSSIRTVLAGRQVVLAFTLDLDWQTDEYGFSANNSWGIKRWPTRFGANLARVAREAGGIDHFQDTLSLVGGLPEGHYFNGESPGLVVFHAASAAPDKGGTPAFSLRNIFSNPGPAFSPGDTLEGLDPDRLEKLCTEIPRFFQAFLADRKLTMQAELERPKERADFETRLWSVRVKTFKFDEFAAGVVPTTPVRNTLLVLNDMSLGTGPVVGNDVINAYIGMTDHRAASVIYGVFRPGPLYCAAFQYDPTFTRVLHALDIGEVGGRVPTSVANLNEQILALFSVGEEIPVFSRNDSSLLGASGIQANSFIFLEARNNSSPRKYYVSGATAELSKRGPVPGLTGPISFFTDGRERVKILTNQKRLAIRPTEKQPDGEGYQTQAELGDDFMAVAASDMESLNRQRISRLRGVSDELAQEFLEKGRDQLTKMQEARAENRHLAYIKALYVSLGAQTKAYLQQSLITNDMLKAVVFYMALMLPFCFFLQKLIFNFTKVEAQMGAFVLLFVGTYVLFRMIHPAFYIAQAPEAMFIAFVMGALGAFVIHILHGRFEGEMHVLFHAVVGSDSSDVGYSTVTQQAMLIGVNNMKRRRIRTALTTGTIVLVTFTMLAFTSISKKMSPTIVAQDQQAPYTGLLFHMPGAPMDEPSLQVLTELFSGEGESVVRRWTLAPSTKESSYPWRLDLVGSGRDVRIEAVLGLDRGEAGFLAPLPLIAGGRFFSADDAEEAILMSSTALALGVTPEQVGQGIEVRFQGRKFQVVGILDDERFGEIKDLDGLPLLPIKKMLTQSGAGDAAPAAMSADENARSGVLFADAATVLVLPQLTARSFKALPYSFSIRFKPGTAIWSVVEKLLTATQAKFYISSTESFAPSTKAKHKTEPGVYYVGTGYHTAIGGLNVLIIPLLIASTIILNTMLGAVFERKNEIAIYNAVGLNPTHIGTFFLAEAFVYSVIGSIGGYLIGQLLSIGLNHFHLVQGINLNFSSLSVVYVIVFTILVVMLSTLYPAIVATKAAVPSGKRTWSMPVHDGQRMEVVMPFICRPDLIVGMMAYLEDYFDRFTEASVGEIIAKLESRERSQDAAGREIYVLRYNLALAPFDLGVTQTVEFQAAYDDRLEAHRIRLRIDRVSGQDNNWVSTNRPFLEKLRAYLMHWRNLGAAQHGLFTERGTQTHAATASEMKA